jgi:hypothetical protein
MRSPSLFRPWRHLDHRSRQTLAPVVGGVLGQVEHKPHRAFTACLLRRVSETFNARILYCYLIALRSLTNLYEIQWITRSFIVYALRQILLRWSNEKDEVGGTRSTHEENEKHVQNTNMYTWWLKLGPNERNIKFYLKEVGREVMN